MVEIEWPGFALKHFFELGPRDRLALQGASGSGKTTLLRWLMGLELHPEARVAGELHVGGESWLGRKPEQREVAVVFQEPRLFPALSVAENVALPLQLRTRLSRKERWSRAKAALAQVGLEERSADGVQGLSGGEQQRIALARALVWVPKLLLLDEPWSAVDPERRAQLREWVTRWQAEHGVPLVWVSHDEQEVQEWATRRLVMT
jgi:ABC-type Fe3+/spermidine/putrescine transport system ATPase subunit